MAFSSSSSSSSCSLLSLEILFWYYMVNSYPSFKALDKCHLLSHFWEVTVTVWTWNASCELKFYGVGPSWWHHFDNRGNYRQQAAWAQLEEASPSWSDSEGLTWSCCLPPLLFSPLRFPDTWACLPMMLSAMTFCLTSGPRVEPAYHRWQLLISPVKSFLPSFYIVTQVLYHTNRSLTNSYYSKISEVLNPSDSNTPVT